MKRYVNALLCAGLLMGVSSIRAEDEQPKSWMKQTGEIVLKTTDILYDFRIILPAVALANYLGYQANMPEIIRVFGQANTVRLVIGLLTENPNRIANAANGMTAAALMDLARQGCLCIGG